MELKLSTWQEVETYLKARTHIIIPIGSTEQHGPMGLIGTDTICPQTIARGVAEETGTLVAPALEIGMSQHHLSFPGSMALRPSTLMAVIKDVVLSLAGHGFTHLFFLNGHGGNVTPVRAAFSEIYAEHSFSQTRSPVHLTLYSWYEGQGVNTLGQKYFKDSEGSHATPSEISLSFFAHPDHIKTAWLTPKIAPNANFRDRFDYADKFSDGRIGSDSSLASPEIGKEIYDAGVRDAVEALNAFIRQK